MHDKKKDARTDERYFSFLHFGWFPLPLLTSRLKYFFFPLDLFFSRFCKRRSLLMRVREERRMREMEVFSDFRCPRLLLDWKDHWRRRGRGKRAPRPPTQMRSLNKSPSSLAHDIYSCKIERGKDLTPWYYSKTVSHSHTPMKRIPYVFVPSFSLSKEST